MPKRLTVSLAALAFALAPPLAFAQSVPPPLPPQGPAGPNAGQVAHQESGSNNTLLYGALALVAVVGVALAAGGGHGHGGSSNSTSTATSTH